MTRTLASVLVLAQVSVAAASPPAPAPVRTSGQAIAAGSALVWSTYLGGSGDEAAEVFNGVADVAIDQAGNVYVTGTTASADFPTTAGADQTAGGNLDVFVTKLSPSGAVLYSTYLGGPCDDTARAIAVDGAGNAYITGRAGGLCYGTQETGVLVAKLGAGGAVLYSTVFGGRLTDTSLGHAIAVDDEGHAFVTGVVDTDSHDFPTTPGAFRTAECPNVYYFANDAFVAQLSADGNDFVYSTLLCGSGDDSPDGIAIDAAGHAYVAGTTASTDFPTRNAFQDTFRGGPVSLTGFVSKLSPDGSDLVYSTYLGGSTNDAVGDIAIDEQGSAYVTGETTSVDFPTTPGALQERAGPRFCTSTCSDAFVTKLAPTGSSLVYSTYLFGELDDAGAGIAVDGAGNAYVIGTTVSSFFPTLDAFQGGYGGLTDAFVVKLAPDGTRLLRSSYLGGSPSGTSPRTGFDKGSSIAVDATGTVYVGGYTQSFDFPTTAGAFQPNLAAPVACDFLGTPCGDVFVAKVSEGPGVLPPVWLTATPEEVADGGIVSVSWAGLPAPSADDHLRLYAIGETGSELGEVIAWWPAPGTAAGTMLLALPAGIATGSYELRLLSPDPDFSNLLSVMARSDVFYVGTQLPVSTTSTSSTSTSSSTTTFPSSTTTLPDVTTTVPGVTTTLPGVTTTIPAGCGTCGDANADTVVTASDSLTALRSAVGAASCPACVCDVNADESVTASDALSILRVAVGLPVSLTCAEG